MEKYKFSIVIPVYNAEKYIKRCVESIVIQNYKNWEIIIINDGSTDGTDAVCKALSKNDSRIRYITKKNEGVSKTRNMGIDIAEGDIVLFVDADDWIEPNMLETIKDNWTTKTDLLMFGFFEVLGNEKSEYHFFDKNIRFSTTQDEYYSKKFLILSILEYYNRNGKESLRQVGVPWAKAFSTKKIKEYGLRFPEEMTLYEDCIFLMNAVQHFSVIEYIKKPLYNYRINSTSICNTIYTEHKKCLFNFNRRKTYISDFIENNYTNDMDMRSAFCDVRVKMIRDTLWWIAEESDQSIRKLGYDYCRGEANEIDRKYNVNSRKDKVYVGLCKRGRMLPIVCIYKILHLLQGQRYR